MAQTGQRTLSDAEQRVVTDGREILMRLWSKAPYTDGQPSNFELEYHDTLISAQGCIDRFRSESAADAPSSTWAQQRLKSCIDYKVNTSTMTVLVPHKYYFDQLRVPLWCNGTCVRDIAPPLVLSAILCILSAIVVGFEPSVSLHY